MRRSFQSFIIVIGLIAVTFSFKGETVFAYTVDENAPVSFSVISSVTEPVKVVGETYGELLSHTFNVYREGGASLWTSFLNLFSA